MNKRKQKTTAEVAKTYTLSRVGEPDGEFKPLYIAKVRGVEFAVGQFATVEEAVAAVNANFAEYLTTADCTPADALSTGNPSTAARRVARGRTSAGFAKKFARKIDEEEKA